LAARHTLLLVKVFVYEHLCGGLAGQLAAAALRREGWAMLCAVLEDFGACAGVETITVLDEEARAVAARLVCPLRVERAEEQAFRRLAEGADYTLVIAPEFDDILYRRCRLVEDVGGRLLGPSSEAVRLAGDKLMLAKRLAESGVATPPTVPWPPGSLPFPFVVKPRFGAGSQATFLICSQSQASEVAPRAAAEGWRGPLVAQPFVPGLTASAAVLIGPSQHVVLPAARQHLSDDGRFRYLGGSAPLPALLQERASALPKQATEAVEGLNGYVGVDMVFGEQDAVIEINPRLTTSYIGLRALARSNLAAAMLQIVRGERVDLQWREGGVRFHADGGVEDGACPGV
jgi:predicted ATP-grasp superfamily ATP-dependent carboligase